MKKILSIVLLGILISSGLSTGSSTNKYDYLIITTENLIPSIISSNFTSWKTQIGYTIKIVSTSDDEITQQQGHDLAEQIRNFLRKNYQNWEINYVIIIGDVNDIPMRYCYPDPKNHKNCQSHPVLYDITGGGEYPTDHYYADLTYPDEESWDADHDGFYGETGEDTPDFKAEIRVGRIPVSIPSRVTYTLDKIVRFEKHTGSWKNNVLHAGCQMWYPNEIDYNSWKYYFNYGELYLHAGVDGAFFLSCIEADYMHDLAITHMSEQSGKIKSLYDWTPLNKESFSSTWRNGKYGVVNWVAHGYPFGILRKVQIRSNSDNRSQMYERKWISLLDIFSTLDDDYPSIVYASSCLVGIPEKNPLGNFAIDLLTKPSFGAAVSIICNTRSPVENPYWPEVPGGSSPMMYTFNRFLFTKSGISIGDALFKMKNYHLDNESWSKYWSEQDPVNADYYLQIDYRMQYSLNLYGDPSLVRRGIEM